MKSPYIYTQKKMNMKKITLITLITISIFSCAKKMNPASTVKSTTPPPPPAAPAPPAPPVEASKPTAEMIASGQKVFEANCGKCHALKNPGDYTQQRWVGLVNWMGPKAKISDSDKALVLAYVQHNAKDAPKDN
jgi:mono/diheme cytochrome c family protein